MNKLRELMQEKAWVGWTIAGVLLLFSVVMYVRSRSGYDSGYMVETLTIRCSETGKEWPMRRGEMERILRGRGFQIDPKQGLPNPDTGKLTGFPKNPVWDESVNRINAERRARLEAGKVPASLVEQQPGPDGSGADRDTGEQDDSGPG